MSRLAAFAFLMIAVLAAAPAADAKKKKPKPSAPSLGVKPFVLTTDTRARKPNVGVDTAGTGHFAWDVSNPAGADPFTYCRVPRGQRECAVTQTFTLPLEAFGEPQVLVSGSTVVLVTHRCCGPGGGTYAIVSNDGGATFGTPVVIGDIEPGQAVLWPGTSTVAFADDVVTAGVSFQAAPFTGPAAASSANVGDGASQSYDGTIGFPTAAAPLVAFDDLKTAFFRVWSGSGDVNSLATWGPTQTLGKLSEVRIATGPKGVVLIGKRHSDTPYFDQYVARRYDPATGTWSGGVAVSTTKLETDVIFRDTFEDAGGNVAVVWDANHTYGSHSDPMRYRVSTDGGRTWRKERTLVAHLDDQGFNFQMGAAPDGGGFVAWDRNSLGPLRAVPIPPIAKQ